MTTNSKSAKASAVKKATKGKQKPDKIFHPESRKAGQMQREALRKAKLAEKIAKRGKKQMARADRYAFFLHALPQDVPCLTLTQLHELVQELWLTRHDTPLKAEQANRRKGRPKSAKEEQLEEEKRLEAEEYRTGLDLPDLTDEHTVGLFRQWDGVDVRYLDILRFIRICGEFPEVIHVARLGRDKDTNAAAGSERGDVDEEMEVERPDALDVSRPGSTILQMDEIPIS